MSLQQYKKSYYNFFLHIFQVSDGPWFQYTENKHWYFYSENEMTWQEAKVSNMYILCNGLCQNVLFSSEICMGQPQFQLHFTFGLMKTFPLCMLFLEFRSVQSKLKFKRTRMEIIVFSEMNCFFLLVCQCYSLQMMMFEFF